MIQAIGPIPVPTPGTPVSVLAAAPSDEMKAAGTWPLHGILFQAFQGNTGRVYVGSATMVKATLVGVYAVLAIPSDQTLPTFSAALTWSPNALRLEDFYVDADVADDGALCTVLVT